MDSMDSFCRGDFYTNSIIVHLNLPLIHCHFSLFAMNSCCKWKDSHSDRNSKPIRVPINFMSRQFRLNALVFMFAIRVCPHHRVWADIRNRWPVKQFAFISLNSINSIHSKHKLIIISELNLYAMHRRFRIIWHHRTHSRETGVYRMSLNWHTPFGTRAATARPTESIAVANKMFDFHFYIVASCARCLFSTCFLISDQRKDTHIY